ncbi:MAG TPA: GAF domain-containing sensor histidine kinase [Actinomycetota bacterium]|nr:GAF domain-containing sensor histidine kinase [Actinomycetota bacterium]
MTRRWPWVVWALTVALMVITLSLSVITNSFSEDPLFLSVAIVMILGYTTIGALIASRTERNPIGWLLMMIGIGFLLGGFTDEYLRYVIPRGMDDAFFTHLAAWLTNWIFAMVALPIPWILLLFPNGKLPTRRWRTVAIAIAVLSAILLLALILNPGPIELDFPGQAPDNPTGVPALEGLLPPIFTIAGFGLLALGFSTVVALALRYRRSVGEERQQMRWFVAAVALAAPLLVAALVSVTGLEGDETTPLSDLLFFTFFLVLAIGLPGACAIAILRYRLYDFDIVVKKTALYTVVALLLVAIFFVFAVLVGRAFIEANPLAILGSIAIGLLFWPVVRLARRIADRIVYGGRATPYEVLTEFSERVAGSYASEDVLPRMARILSDAVGARDAIVWLHVGTELRPSGIASPDGDPPAAVPLRGDAIPPLQADAAVEVRDQGELLGALSVSMPANDPINPSKERLVRDLASQAGLVLRNVRLIEELRASRQRLVAAQDAERRRLERNIHDGAQQQLVALTVKLRLLEQLAERDPTRARAMAEQIQVDATGALDDLRDLARGIYPPLLADKGLPAALEAQARKSPVPVSVECDDLGRFPQDVEAAIYFSCLEALQNVTKYAEATQVRVALARTDGALTFAVSDDGVGFDPSSTSAGTGLQGIADRMDALGGTFAVTSATGQGTVLRGTVPLA